MPNNLSNYAESGLLAFMFRADALSKPAMWLALTSTVPLETDTGATIPEIAHGNGYARVVVTGNTTWGVPDVASEVSGTIVNLVAIAFNQNTTADWGYVSGVAILDASGDAAGNMWWYGSLATPKLITVGDTFSIPTGSAIIKIA